MSKNSENNIKQIKPYKKPKTKKSPKQLFWKLIKEGDFFSIKQTPYPIQNIEVIPINNLRKLSVK